ncbi:unnamed protein product [Caenorhabditis auriculariae]|uniref:PID domain-containing protein n=1 Tax=Caenorhabditis auriculariae TaxID=2777116 RepID=A0A8S1HS12_9PELO|nr:unnamed protein product [Caenorhabditis auriculariae]
MEVELEEVIAAKYVAKFEMHSLDADKTSNRSIEEKIIEQIDNAQILQQEGKTMIKRDVSSKGRDIKMKMSKHGIVIYNNEGKVALRIPLFQIVLVTAYSDEGRQNGVILESSQFHGERKKFFSHIVQFNNDQDGLRFCEVFKDIFLRAEDEQEALQSETEPPSPSMFTKLV